MSSWAQHPDRLLLLELYALGRARHRKCQEAAWDRMHAMRWTYAIGKHDEAIADTRRDDLVRLLSDVWPTWRDSLADLTSAGELPTPEGWRSLEDVRRQSQAPTLPARINQHTLAAAVAPHAKSTLTASRIACAGDVDITHDGSLRIRPSRGLLARAGDREIDLWSTAHVLGEVIVTDRAIRDGLSLAGEMPTAVITIENLGTYMDAPLPDGWLAIHVPGWNTALIPSVVTLVPNGIPWIHWGDYDRNGLRITRNLRASRPGLTWFVPDWIGEYTATHARPADWSGEISDDAPGQIQHLMRSGVALEQEILALDDRLVDSLIAALQRSREA